MKICLVCSEIFAWGKYGGFGRATRMLGRELARLGHEVVAVTPRRGSQRSVETLDGITVLGFAASRPWEAASLYREVDADLYHSQQPSLGTDLALRARPARRHIATARDPKDARDWWTEMRSPSRGYLRGLLGYLYEGAPLVRRAVARSDGLYYCARFLEEKVRRVYRWKRDLGFLPTPVEVPAADPVKASRPTVCFVGRWDRRKRPELFFELARAHPDVHFIALGKSQDEARNRALMERYASVSNVELTGFINQFESDKLTEVLGRSWILINTATREGLPTSFLEALAHRCALLSALDPEGVTSRFGVHVRDGDFSSGLRQLLEADRWRERGIAGFRYASEHYELQHSIRLHLDAYRRVLDAEAGARGRV